MTCHLFVPFLYLKLMTHIVCLILSPMLFPIPNLLLFLPFTYPNDILSFQITLFKYVINIYAEFSKEEGNCVWWRLPTLTFLEIIQWNFWMTIIYCKWKWQCSFTKHFKLRLGPNSFPKSCVGSKSQPVNPYNLWWYRHLCTKQSTFSLTPKRFKSRS